MKIRPEWIEAVNPYSWAYRDLLGQPVDHSPRFLPRSSSASAGVNPMDDVLFVSGNTTMTLETAVGCDGRRHTFIKTDSGTTMVIACTGSETIDGASTLSISNQYSGVQVVSDGTNWKTQRIPAELLLFLQSGTGATSETIQDVLRVVGVTPQQFGAVADGVVDDYTAFTNAYTAAQASGKVIYLPGATYKLGTKWTISHSKIRIIALGKVILNFTGTGDAVEIDGGVGGGIYDVVFGGDIPITIKGNANCTDALYMRAAHHCDININARECSSAGLRTEWCVGGTIRFTCTINEEAMTTRPASCIVLDDRGAGEVTTDITFVGPINEIPGSTGWDLQAAQGIVVLGGTSEGCSKGVEDTATSQYNTFIGHWFEANTASDVELRGEGYTFIHCRSVSAGSTGSVEIITAEGTVFIGGIYRKVNLQSDNTVFHGVKFYETAGLGIQGAGTYKVYGCHSIAVATGLVTAVINDRISLTADVTGDLPYSSLAQGAALSVLGVTGNATADNASIAAGSDHQVLRRSGTAVAFGAVNLAQSAAVTGTLPIGNGGTGNTTGNAASITVANEGTDTTCFPLFVTAATGDLQPKTNAAFTFNSNTGAVSATNVTATGILLAGVTSQGSAGGITATHTVETDVSGQWALLAESSHASDPFGLAIEHSGTSINAAGNFFLYCIDNGPTLRADIASDGGLDNYSANNSNLSDERLKSEKVALDMAAAAEAWSRMNWWRFKYSDQNHTDFNTGYMAQEVAEVFKDVAPELVECRHPARFVARQVEGQRVVEKVAIPVEDQRLSVYYDDLHNLGGAALTWLLQDYKNLKAEVEQLKARQ